MNPTRWLVAHDFSENGQRAAEVAASDLERAGGELHIVHVYSVPSVPLSYEWGGVDAIYASSHELETALKTDVVRTLENAAERLRETHPRLEIFTHVHAGQPSQAILTAADELGADRIIVGSAGRTGLSHFLLGSVAERVVRLARCPVLVVKVASDAAREEKESRS